MEDYFSGEWGRRYSSCVRAPCTSAKAAADEHYDLARVFNPIEFHPVEIERTNAKEVREATARLRLSSSQREQFRNQFPNNSLGDLWRFCQQLDATAF